ncbi:MAG: alpha/beta hydrolase [Proteobacteria bacterium]|nr:alpha/beta hydrolase [Pseudomonadota bacterium]
MARRLLRRSLSILAALAVSSYIAAAAYMGFNQKHFIFRVDPAAPVIANAGLPQATETTFKTRDGIGLTGWQIPPARPDAPVFVYFHGNAGTLMRRAERFRLLTSGGAGLIAFHYRGYGGSGGEPAETALVADAKAIFAETERRFPGHPRIIFGESLGTGIATQLAAGGGAAALILDSPFVSVLDRASATYPWLPVGLLLNHPFRSDLAIPQVKMPVLILHGEKDQVIPITDGERLFMLTPEPKRFERYPDAGHVGAFRFGAMEDIRRFLATTTGLRV